MEQHERDYLVARIRAGYLRCNIKDTILRVYPPNPDINYEAQTLYLETYQRALENGLLEDIDALNLLEEYGWWTDEDTTNLEKTLPDHIDEFKVQLYQALFKSKTRREIRIYLDAARDELERLTDIRHSFDYVTCHGAAVYARWQYLIENCTYHNNSIYDFEHISVSTILAYTHDNTISDKQIRELARTEPWHSYWAAGKKNGKLFSGELTDEQKRIIMWSYLYDSIAEASESPHDSVIEDDDMLDGWLILKRRESDKEKKKKIGEDRVSEATGRHAEVFLVAQTDEDAKLIDEMNSAESRAIKRQRSKQIHEAGVVTEANLLDVKRGLIMEARRQNVQAIKERTSNG